MSTIASHSPFLARVLIDWLRIASLLLHTLLAIDLWAVSTVAEKPSKPTNLKVKDIWKDHMTVLWDAPQSDGGSTITGYTLEQRDAFDVNYKFVANTEANITQYQVLSLTVNYTGKTIMVLWYYGTRPTMWECAGKRNSEHIRAVTKILYP